MAVEGPGGTVRPPMTILRALCIAKTLKGEGELGDALRILADAYTDRNEVRRMLIRLTPTTTRDRSAP